MRAGVIKAKSDVYSFGMFLLELLTGQSITRDGLFEDVICRLIDAASPDLEALLDPKVEMEAPKPEAMAIAVLAKHSINKDWDYRPNMDEVVQVLHKAIALGKKYEAQKKEQQEKANGSS